MPALRLFGRRTLMAGDDLQLPALSALLVRTFQSFVLVPPVLAHLILEARRCADETTGGGGVDGYEGNVSEEGREGGEGGGAVVMEDPEENSDDDEGGLCDTFWDYFLRDPSVSPSSGDGGGDDNDSDAALVEGACRSSHVFPLLLLIYVCATLLYCMISAYAEFRLCRSSSIGTPTEPRRRSPYVERWMEQKYVWLAGANAVVFLIGATAVGGFAGRYYGCVEALAAGRKGGGGGGFGIVAGDGDDGRIWNSADDDWMGEELDVRLFGNNRRRLLESEGSDASDADPVAVALSMDGPKGYRGSEERKGDTWFSSYEDVTDPDAWVSSLYFATLAEVEAVPNLLGQTAWWYALLLLLLSQMAECALSALSLIRLCRLPKEREDGSDYRLEEGEEPSGFRAHHHQRTHGAGHELVEEMWRERCDSACRCMAASTCFLFGGRELSGGSADTYSDVAELLADYFEDGGSLDVVPSDVVAGLIMLGRVQGERVARARREVIQSTDRERRFADEVESSGSTDALLGPLPGGTSSPSAAAAAVGARYPSSGSLDRCGGEEDDAEEERDRGTTLGPSDDAKQAAKDSADTDADADEARQRHPRHETALQFRTSRSSARAASEDAPAARDDGDETASPVPRPVLSRDDERDRATVAEGARFARHALAIYTWMLYVYMHPATGVCRLACGAAPACACLRRRRRRPRRRTSDGDDANDNDNNGRVGPVEGPYEGDNICHSHKKALLLHAGLDSSDVAYASFESGMSETPYCVVVDHRWSSVVLSVRGTLSLEDCMVDVLVDPEPLDELGEEEFGFEGGREQHCHGGVLVCSRWIYQDLQRHGILDRLLGPNAQYPSYRLRVVGHSLGAGCAAILSFMLRRRYPTLRCLCYSPPGGFLSRDLAFGCKNYVTSFVLDSDLVPRLSVDNMENLRDEVLDLIGRIKVNKLEVAHRFVAGGISGFLSSCCWSRNGGGAGGGDDDLEALVRGNADLLSSRGAVDPDTDFSRSLGRFRDVQADRKRRRAKPRVPLFPPGRIVHLVKTAERTSCRHGLFRCVTCGASNAGSEYTPVYVQNDDFDEIVISPTFWTDHFPDRVCLEIEGVARAFGLDTTLGSSPSEGDRDRALVTRSPSGQDFSEIV